LFLKGRAMAQAVNSPFFTMEARVQSQINPRVYEKSSSYARQSNIGTGVSPRTSFLCCQYHSTNGSYSSSSIFIYLLLFPDWQTGEG
jgi:hypothetical protein